MRAPRPLMEVRRAVAVSVVFVVAPLGAILPPVLVAPITGDRLAMALVMIGTVWAVPMALWAMVRWGGHPWELARVRVDHVGITADTHRTAIEPNAQTLLARSSDERWSVGWDDVEAVVMAGRQWALKVRDGRQLPLPGLSDDEAASVADVINRVLRDRAATALSPSEAAHRRAQVEQLR